MSEEVETLGEAPLPLMINYQGQPKLNDYMQFSYSVTPPPRVSGSSPVVGHKLMRMYNREKFNVMTCMFLAKK